MVSISGKTFRAIEIAVGELGQHGLSVEKYQIVVHNSLTEPNTMVVLFDDPDRPPNLLGSSPNLVGFEVHLDADTLAVTRSHFVK